LEVKVEVIFVEIVDSNSPEVETVTKVLAELVQGCPSIKLSIVIFPKLDCALPYPSPSAQDSFQDVNLAIEITKFLVGQIFSRLKDFSYGNLYHAMFRTDKNMTLLLSAFSPEEIYLFWIDDDLNETISTVSTILSYFIDSVK
jgi:hypothetical protein